MIVTGAFLADYARRADDKLDVLGAVWDWCVLPDLTHSLEAYLVVLLQRGPDDLGVPGEMRVSVSDTVSDDPVHTAVLPVSGTLDGEQQAVAFPIALRCRTTGRHVIRIAMREGDPGFTFSLDVRTLR